MRHVMMRRFAPKLKPKWNLHLGAVRIGLGLPQEFFRPRLRQQPTGQWYSNPVPEHGPPSLWVSPWLQFSSTLRILSGVSERGCNSMVQGSRKFLDISVGSG